MRVLVDMTETALHGYNTGIQRVVRNVVSRAPALSTSLGVEVVPVAAIGRRLFAVKDPGRAGFLRTITLPGNLRGTLGHRVKRTLSRVIERMPGGKVALELRRRRRLYAPLRSQELEELPAGVGDVYMLLDSFSGGSTVISAFAAVHRLGVKTVLVMYDLIPVTHPEFCAERVVTEFRSSCPKVLREADAVLAISAATAAQTTQYAAEAVPGWDQHQCPVGFAHLGADFVAMPSAGRQEEEHWSRWPDGLWDDGNVFLMLGTLEPRKGHAFVLDAFEKRWSRGSRDKLLFVGNLGWKMEQFAERLRTCLERGRLLFHVSDAPDSAVAEAIRRSCAGIMASTVEGFGLPVVEFMQRGLPVLASDIPVFREVGGEYPLYFPLGNPECLDKAIDEFLVREREVRQKVSGFCWITWDEAAENLIRKALELCG